MSKKSLQKSDVGRYKGDLKSIEVKEVESEEEFQEEEEVRSPLKNNKQNIINNKSPNGKKAAASSGGLFSSFKSLVGSKTLTKEMIEPVMEKMQEHLVGNGQDLIKWKIKQIKLSLFFFIFKLKTLLQKLPKRFVIMWPKISKANTLEAFNL